MRQYLDLLRRNSDIRYIWFAEVVSLVGDWFSYVVLAALVVSRSPGREGFAASSLILARFVPPLFLSPLAGVLLDRFNRKQLLVWSNILRSAIGLLYLVAITDPALVWLIYIGVILQATVGTIYMPGQSALVAGVVTPEDLVTANTLSNATWSAALAAGGALGGFVAASFGSSTALVFDAGTFFLAGLLLTRIKGYRYVPAPRRQPSRDAAPDDAPQATVRDGLRYIRAHPQTLVTLFVKFGGSLGNVDSFIIILATQVFAIGAGGQLSLGILYSAFGIGAIFGPIITNALSDGSGRALRRWIVVGFVAQALGWVIIGWASTLILVCAGLIMRGMGGSVNWTYSSVLLQRTTPDQYRGRVFSIDSTLFTLATAFATLVHGTLIDALSSETLAVIPYYLVPPSAGATSSIGLIAYGTAVLSALPLIAWIWAQRSWRGEAVASAEPPAVRASSPD